MTKSEHNLNHLFLSIQQGQPLDRLIKLLNTFDPCSPVHLSSPKTGDNPLIIAARFGHLEFLRYLIKDKGWDTELKNLDGKTALHEAAYNSRLNVLLYLVHEAKANVNAVKKADWTPLMLACAKTDCDERVVVELLRASADTYFRNKDGWNCLHLATRSGLLNVVSIILSHLSSASAKRCLANTPSKNGRRPLHTAAMHGRLEIAEFLLRECLQLEDVDVEDNCGTTPAMDAARFGHLDLLNLLVNSFKAKLERSNKGGMNPLHIASEAGQVQVIRTLVNQYGMDPNSPTTQNPIKTPMWYAQREGQKDAALLLKELGAKD